LCETASQLSTFLTRTGLQSCHGFLPTPPSLTLNLVFRGGRRKSRIKTSFSRNVLPHPVLDTSPAAHLPDPSIDMYENPFSASLHSHTKKRNIPHLLPSALYEPPGHTWLLPQTPKGDGLAQGLSCSNVTGCCLSAPQSSTRASLGWRKSLGWGAPEGTSLLQQRGSLQQEGDLKKFKIHHDSHVGSQSYSHYIVHFFKSSMCLS